MREITIMIDDSKFQTFMELIKTVDYIHLKKDQSKHERSKAKEDDFFALAGMWEGKDVSAVEIRKKAWPKTR